MKDKVFLTKYKVYWAWEADKEEQDLNEASQNGWQLIRGGCFWSKFRRDPAARYRYRIDYRRSIPDMMDYRMAFEEQGWEYVNATFNGWHYFRKAWDPALPESAYEIYTDRHSLRQMQNRWIGLLVILGLVCAAIGVYNVWLGTQGSLWNGVIGAVDLVLTLVILLGSISEKRKLNGKKGLWSISASAFFPVLFAVLIAATAFFVHDNAAANRRDYRTLVYKESRAVSLGTEEAPPPGGTFTVDQSGWYAVGFVTDTGGAEVEMVLSDENQNILLDVKTGEFCNSTSSLRLEKGMTYQTEYRVDTGGLEREMIIIMTVFE